jgi:hypothetical protein
MDNLLYSPILNERLIATRQYLTAAEKSNPEFYPEGLRGAANAYAVLVGPGYGAYNGNGEKYAGGFPRPTSKWSKRLIGGGLGFNPFSDSGKPRKWRWNRLLLACLGSQEVVAQLSAAYNLNWEHHAEAVEQLSAIYNLDWGNHADEQSIPPCYLSSGEDVVVKYILLARPRFIIPLSRLVWGHLASGLQRAGGEVLREGVLPKHESRLIRLPSDGASEYFEAVVARPHNHPSRHFLTAAWIETFGKELAPFRED